MRKSDPSPPTRGELSVVYLAVDALRRYENNARTHPPEQVEQIAASILEFGFNNPILLKDDGQTIGAGHGRLDAAELILSRGQALPTPTGATVPTITLSGLTESQWRAYVLADNKLALGSEWDMDILAAELAALQEDNADLPTLAGFSDDEVDALLAEISANFEPIHSEAVKPLDRLVMRSCPSCGHEFRE